MAQSDLSGPSLLDDLYFVIHDNVTGQALLHSRLASLALAGGVLGELMLAERVTVVPAGRETVVLAPEGVHPRGDVGDPLTDKALGHIAAEPHHPLGTWLEFLARTVHADVTARMVAAGLLRAPGRHLFRQQPPVPVDINRAAWPLARLNLAVGRRAAPAVRDRVLYGLLVAAGCAQGILSAHDPAFADAMTATLAPPLRALIAQTAVAVGRTVISRR